MMICPRCSANNDTGTSACWNCLAPLQGALANRVKPMVLVGRGDAPAPEAAPEGDIPPPPEPTKKRGLFGRK